MSDLNWNFFITVPSEVSFQIFIDFFLRVLVFNSGKLDLGQVLKGYFICLLQAAKGFSPDHLDNLQCIPFFCSLALITWIIFCRFSPFLDDGTKGGEPFYEGLLALMAALLYRLRVLPGVVQFFKVEIFPP